MKEKNRIGTRRIVTGHSEKGKAIIVSDEIVDGLKLESKPGRVFTQLWGANSIPQHPDNGIMEQNLSWFPPSGGFRFFMWVIPPKGTETPLTINENEAKKEIEEKLPGFQQYFESDNPGMHTTDTVDFAYLISGTAVLELDDGVEVEIVAGDTVVQNGTRHRWNNRSLIPAVFVSGSVGSERK
ncbi:MAG: cupin domain-containing protein [Salinivirgaceae bacterium]|nr:cupin domain-containing protein [Salinivirgaceae bacterium]